MVSSVRRKKLQTCFNVHNQAPHPTTNRITEIFPSLKGDGSIFLVDKVLSNCFLISRRMTFLQRLAVDLREQDGGIHWETLMQHVQGFREQTASWTLDDWKDCPMNGTDKIWFEYCLDQHGQNRYMRSIQSHSGGVDIDPKLQDKVQIPYGHLSCWVLLCVQVHMRRRTSCTRNQRTRKKTNMLLHSCEPDDQFFSYLFFQ